MLQEEQIPSLPECGIIQRAGLAMVRCFEDFIDKRTEAEAFGWRERGQLGRHLAKHFQVPDSLRTLAQVRELHTLTGGSSVRV